MSYCVVSFYKFVRLSDFREKQEPLLEVCQKNAIKGTIHLSLEGINGTISGTTSDIETVINYLHSDPRFADLETKQSFSDHLPFARMKVRLKQEIVTLGMPEIDPSETVGNYVNSDDWNELISDPEVTVIDTRNTYEVDIGSFQGAINPHTHSFREFPDYVRHNLDPNKNTKIAMFCTGGIRCEKATSFLLKQGFKEVYHLKGGILKYLEDIPEDESLWQGECFVFDERIAVKHELEEGSYEMCLGCGHPISEEDKQSSEYEQGVSCPYCFSSLTPEKLARQREKQRQLTLKYKSVKIIYE